MKLFQGLVEYQQIEKWVPLLDWLLSNERFSEQKGWDSNKKRTFTTRIKKLSGISKETWRVEPAKKAVWAFDKTDCVQIVMNSDSSEGESFIRHVRNGIAHGSVRILNRQSTLYLDIEDYKDDKHQKQTAHIWMPIDFLFDVYHLYEEVEGQSSLKSKKKK